MVSLRTHGSHLGTMGCDERELPGESSVNCLLFVTRAGLENNKEKLEGQGVGVGVGVSRRVATRVDARFDATYDHRSTINVC